jgi:hypothetical protein
MTRPTPNVDRVCEALLPLDVLAAGDGADSITISSGWCRGSKRTRYVAGESVIASTLVT